MTAPEWRDCADPDELAAAVAAGVEVRALVMGEDMATTNQTPDRFAGSLRAGTTYRVPTSWTWRAEPPATGAERYLAGRMADPEYRAAYEATSPPDGCEAVFLPTGLVDEWCERVGMTATMDVDTIDACREAQARRGTAPTTEPPAGDSEPPGVKRRTRREVTDDFTAGTRTIREWVKGGGVLGPALCEELDAWLDYWGGSPATTPTPPPAPPWPGAVLSGLTDEDGVPTWLAQAGQVRGADVRPWRLGGWVGDTYAASEWVEVRAPRAVPEPETERVPWWESVGRACPHDGLIDGVSFLCSHDAPRVHFVGGGHMDVTHPERTVQVLKATP